MPYLAGQHVILRLTAPDGYQASRSYSIAGASDGSDQIELTVDRLDDGEVSSFLHDVVMVGDRLELRGPIGGYFVWRGDTTAVLVGGGSGIVPLMAMLRQARRTDKGDLLTVVVSARRPAELYYADELPGPQTTIVYTREGPPNSNRPAGRLRRDDIPALRPGATAYVCGTSGFADTATDLLLGAGMAAADIRVERFGPT
jgi:ferredoxin-NADP reductase